MELLDELRIQYRRLKSRQLAAMEARRAERMRSLLVQIEPWFQQRGFQVSITDGLLRATQAARVVLLRADSEEEIRIGEFLAFSYADSQGDRKPLRITAQLEPGAIPEHGPIDVDTRDSIVAQIAYMEARLAEGDRALQGFEVRQTMTMANYREPQPDRDRRLFASFEEAIAHLLDRAGPDTRD